ncbi:PaaI family thioesterase [Castellaniella sp.]|uniref:PaaI family thioesterase n=1 Tax=Castellaniella sp. TaxID=1955812 RepID=UPI003C78D0C0
MHASHVPPTAPRPLSVLEYLQRQLDGTLTKSDITHMRYPTAISQLLGFRIIAIGEGTASLQFEADAAIHGNQQGTVHGGLLCELADAAIGTAHSTLVRADESFTSIDLKANFLRPVWASQLRINAWASHRGRTVSRYRCDIQRGEDGMVVATFESVVMALRGDAALGR